MPAQKRNSKRPLIVWAVDPFDQDPKRSKGIEDELKNWTLNLGAEILPVAVVSPYEVSWPVDWTGEWQSRFESLAKDRLKQRLEKMRSRNSKLKGLLSPKVIVRSAGSVTSSAKLVAELAERKRATLIAADTHGDQIKLKSYGGSFVETLISASSVPVLTLNPKSRTTHEIKSVLFPTDFSPESRHTLSKLLRWAKSLRPEIVLFHQIPFPDLTTFAWECGLPERGFPVDQLMVDAENARTQTMNKWIKWIERHGLKARGHLEKQLEPLEDAIRNQAKRLRVSIVAMATDRGPVSQKLLGSAASEVVRDATCPVLVFHQ